MAPLLKFWPSAQLGSRPSAEAGAASSVELASAAVAIVVGCILVSVVPVGMTSVPLRVVRSNLPVRAATFTDHSPPTGSGTDSACQLVPSPAADRLIVAM